MNFSDKEGEIQSKWKEQSENKIMMHSFLAV